MIRISIPEDLRDLVNQYKTADGQKAKLMEGLIAARLVIILDAQESVNKGSKRDYITGVEG